MKIYFGSVIYLEALPYFEEFLHSISEQTIKDFSLFLICDSIDEKIIENRIRVHGIEQFELVSYEGMSPVELRVELLKGARKRNADILILGDADDTFSCDRVENIKNVFMENEECTFVYNNIAFENGRLFFAELPNKIDDVENILEFNYLGLSNTAVRIKKLPYSMLESLRECESYVFDWYFYSRLLVSGFKGRLSKNGITFYRLHDNNYAGRPKINIETIKKEVKIKQLHYKMMSRYDIRYKSLYREYQNNKYIVVRNEVPYYWWNHTKGKEEDNEI